MGTQFQQRAQACPTWIRTPVILLSFALPLIWVVCGSAPFTVTLDFLSEQFGETAEFRHALSYLLCVLSLLLPAGLLVQVVGARHLNDRPHS